MARKRPVRSTTKAQKQPSRLVRRLILAAVILAAIAPSIHRGLWRLNEQSKWGAAVEAFGASGCLTCHPWTGTELRWRSDGESPPDTADIRNAIEHGRPAVPGMPGPMPASAGRFGRKTLDRLALGAEIYAGLITVSDEPEVRIGLTIAEEMGCFDCHGPMGAGGVANPGTVGGQIPGFFGTSFAKQSESLEGIEGIIRTGRSGRRAWWTPWKRPALDMPAYGDRLDSVEIQLLAHATRSLSGQND